MPTKYERLKQKKKKISRTDHFHFMYENYYNFCAFFLVYFCVCTTENETISSVIFHHHKCEKRNGKKLEIRSG